MIEIHVVGLLSSCIQDAPEVVAGCQSSLVSRKAKNESMVSGAMLTLSSGTIPGLVSLVDSRQRVSGVILVSGMMDAVVVRSCSAEKHAVRNFYCQKVLSTQL